MEYAFSPLLGKEDEEEVSLCCGFVRQKRRKRQETISDLLDRLGELERAENMRANGLWSQMAEKKQEAVKANREGDVDGARSHTRIFMQIKAKRIKMLKKRENLISISDTLGTAYQNAVQAHLISDSNATLESLAAAMPGDLDDLVDRLKDNLQITEEGSERLSEPLVFQNEDVDEELNGMIERRDDEEAMGLELPDAFQPKAQKAKSSKIQKAL